MKDEQAGFLQSLKRELDELSLVWSNEEEKTRQMQKLLSSLFCEVEEIDTQQQQFKDFIAQLGEDFKT